MFRFFRNVRHQLFNTNVSAASGSRVGKYLIYSIGEIVLVVLGILIALQINTWNQNRLNAKEEQRILSSISEELQLNKFLFSKGSERQKNRLLAASSLLEEISTGQYVKDEFDANIKTLTSRWLSGTPTSIYDALIGSGDMKYVSSEELRNQITDLKSDQEFLGLFEQILVRFVDDRLNPFLNQYINRGEIQSKRSSSSIIKEIPILPYETSYAAMIES